MDETGYILAFDTSTPNGRCSLLRPAEAAGEEAFLPGEVRISRTLLPRVEQILGARNARAETIRAIGVSIGPGTFTGLRVGLSCAKGLALGWGRPLYGFSSLEIMATAALKNELRAGRNPPDYVLPYRDARYGEFFTALFRVAASAESPWGFALTRVREDETVAPDAFRLPEDGDTLLAGRKEELPGGLSSPASPKPGGHQEVECSAAAAAWLTCNALRNPAQAPGGDVSLNYCRKSQAQTKWAAPEG